MRQIYSFLLFFISMSTLFAQGNTLVLGELKNETSDFVRLQIDKKYLDLSSIEYTTIVNEEGKFGFSTYMHEGQLIKIFLHKTAFQIFLDPLDSLQIHIENIAEKIQLNFSGNSSAVINNSILQNFYQKYPKDTLVFNYKNYKRGFFYYEIHENIDRKMQQLPPIDFLNFLENERSEKINFINTHQGYSKDFYNYMLAEINYYFYYHYLAYAHIYKGRWQINTNDFLFSLTQKQNSLFQNEYIHNNNYRRFCLAYAYYNSEIAEKKHENPYLQWYYTAYELINEKSQPLILAQIIDLTLKKENPHIVKEIYEHFLTHNPYIEFDKLVAQGMQKIQSLPIGKVAGNFKLYDNKGNMLSLSDLKGKVVYLDFWASWCRPCLEKLQGLEEIKAKLIDKNIVFVHINLDKDNSIWQKTLAEKSFTGIHLFRDAAHEVERLYDVYSVPKFFFINTEGVLSFTPSTTNLSDIEKALLNLLSKKP